MSDPQPSNGQAEPTSEPSPNGQWVRRPSPVSDAMARVVICPHAGSSASAYAALAGALAPDVEALVVQYPGRQDRRHEPGLRRIEALADGIDQDLAEWLDRPLAVVGHSMGAAVAFEVARRLEAEGTQPIRLFVSGRRAPSAGLGLPPPTSDEVIVAELRRTAAVPPRLLARPAYRDSILAVVRHDFHANATYLCPQRHLVRAPITFLLSANDPYVGEDDLTAWAGHTTADLRVVRLPGGHDLYTEHQGAVLTELRADLGIGT